MKLAAANPRTRLAPPLLALLIIAAGAALRLWNADSNPLWLDEAYSVYAATKDLHFLWNVVPLYETHPPFYYTLLHFWTLAFGDGTIAVRALGLACGIATLPLIALAAREIGLYLALSTGRIRLLVGATLVMAAFSPFMVAMSNEVRPYPVMMLVMAAETCLLFRMARRAQAGAPLWSAAFAGHLLLLALMMWLHNLGPLHGGAIGLGFLFLVFRRDWSRTDWAAFLIGHLVVAAAWAPALYILIDQAPTWIKSTWLHFSWPGLGRGAKTLWATPGLVAPIAAALLALAGAAALAGKRSAGARTLAALLVMAGAPFTIAAILSVLVAPVFLPRTLTPVMIPGMLLVGSGLALAPRRLVPLAALVLALLAWPMGKASYEARAAGNRLYWFEVVDWVAPRFSPGDEIWTYPNEAALPLRYALRDRGLDLPVRPIPTDMPTLDPGPGAWNPTGSRGVFSLSKARLEGIAASPMAERVPTIWLFRMGAWSYDPGDHFRHALMRDREVVAEWGRRPIDMIGLRRKDGLSGRRDDPAGAGAAR